MVRWGMVIDLTRCMGCRTCMVACKVENNTQEGAFWMFVYKEEERLPWMPGFEPGRQFPNANLEFMPKPCLQCDEPPCVQVCPVKATFRREDGIVLINYDHCIGCKYCIQACPYASRYFNGKSKETGYYYNWAEEGTNVYGTGSVSEHITQVPPYQNPDHDQKYMGRADYPGGPTMYESGGIAYKGVTTKCTWCVHRIDSGLKKDLTPGIDREATPACAVACPVNVIHFGDLDDPESNVSKLIASRNYVVLKPELGTKPRVYYLLERGVIK